MGRGGSPFARGVARVLQDSAEKRKPLRAKAVTGSLRSWQSPAQSAAVQHACAECGCPVGARQRHCAKCARGLALAAALNGKAQAQRAATARRNRVAEREWDAAGQPAWLTPDVFAREVVPRLAAFSNVAVRNATGVSLGYAALIRSGARHPHPRHWAALAMMAGVAAPTMR